MNAKNTILTSISFVALGLASGCADVPEDSSEINSEVSGLGGKHGGKHRDHDDHDYGDHDYGDHCGDHDYGDGDGDGDDECEGTAVLADAVVSTNGVLNRVRVCADFTGDPDTDRGATGLIRISAAPPEPSVPTLEGTITCARSSGPGDVVISGVITTPGNRFGWGYIAALRDGLQGLQDFVTLPIPFPTGGVEDPLRCNRLLSPTAGEVVQGAVVVPLLP